MRILGHIHTFNDEEIIERSLKGVLNQTYPVDEVVLVDNGSRDSTLKRSFPPNVTIIRHKANEGTSGAVVSGMKYALDGQFDWIWIFDADSVPEPDALEKLVILYQSFTQQVQDQIWRLSSLPLEHPKWAVTTPASLRLAFSSGNPAAQPRHGVVFTSRGYNPVKPGPNELFYECDGTLWTGSLFKLDVVRKIGLPRADYVLDWGEYEYGYVGKRAGYRGLMSQSSIVNHNITGDSSLSFTQYKIGPMSFKMLELAPIRCYYVIRNTLYFWLYEYQYRNIHTLGPRIFKISMLILNFVLRPVSHWLHLSACLRGVVAGLTKRIYDRY